MINIRAATIDDLDVIHRLGESVPEFAVNKDETVTFWPKSTLRRALQSNDVIIFVAEKGQQMAGFIIANYSDGLRKAIIENVFVISEFRGQGIADQLLDKLVQQLDTQQCEYIATLIPPEAHGATELYTRAGFSKGETFLWLDKSLANDFKSSSTDA